MFIPESLQKQMGGRRNSQQHHLTQWGSQMLEERHKKIAVGILIGERWTSVASYEDGIITDVIKKMPSVISFTPEKAYFGSEALRHSFSNIANTVYAFFGLLGREFSDRSVQQLSRHVTYKIGKLDSKHSRISGAMKENIGIPITHFDDTTIYTPIQLVSQFLEYLIKKASRQLNCDVSNIAISVPNTFGQRQRQALMQAAKIAKIPSVRLVTSCLATCVYSRFYQRNSIPFPDNNQKQVKLSHRVQLILDVSHISCSLAIVESKQIRKTDIVRVHITSGTELGGVSQILNKFSLHVVTQFVEEYQNHHYDIQNNYLTQYNNQNTVMPNNINSSNKNASDIMQNRTINTTIDHKNPQPLVRRPKHTKKLSMAERILSQYSQLNELELKHFESPENSDNEIDEKTKEDRNNAKYDKTQNKSRKEEPLVQHLIRQSSLANGISPDEEIKDEIDDTNNSNNKIMKKQREKTIEEKKQEEAMKCRFRARMICANVLEHLHDRYQINISLHYDGFFSDSSLHLLMKLHTLDELIIKPFVFEIHQHIDGLLQEAHLKNERERVKYLKNSKIENESKNDYENDIENININNNNKKNKKRKKRKKKRKDKILNLNSIRECVITGDGSHIPAITQLIDRYFDINEHFQKKPVIARGAALVCAVDQELAKQPLCLEILPMTIKMQDPLDKNRLHTILEKHSSCPCKKTITVTNWKENQTELRLKFYEGDGLSPDTCTFVGQYAIRGIERRPLNKSKIVITSHVDRNCLFIISAEDLTDENNAISLQLVRGA